MSPWGPRRPTLPDSAAGTNKLRFEFHSDANTSIPGGGWWIDDVKLTAVPVLSRAIDEPSAYEPAEPEADLNVASTRSLG